jgi:hypothetical protein
MNRDFSEVLLSQIARVRLRSLNVSTYRHAYLLCFTALEKQSKSILQARNGFIGNAKGNGLISPIDDYLQYFGHFFGETIL